eukprot:CAMPEP_0118958114 /NCGR_PEP_ID=MMETSP1169-20130426/62456_1 /TAXON_ID=36882 /ORGANISM="Pyramimonas obovata, Strain CCMP722" /LENGTH=213 /DNA_ID=CAMNT_0006906221 /DNA_START=304 /DNA_END=946 /DNA_ORIENTATION=-
MSSTRNEEDVARLYLSEPTVCQSARKLGVPAALAMNLNRFSVWLSLCTFGIIYLFIYATELEALPPQPDEQREEEEVARLARAHPEDDEDDPPDDRGRARLERVSPVLQADAQHVEGTIQPERCNRRGQRHAHDLHECVVASELQEDGEQVQPQRGHVARLQEMVAEEAGGPFAQRWYKAEADGDVEQQVVDTDYLLEVGCYRFYQQFGQVEP